MLACTAFLSLLVSGTTAQLSLQLAQKVLGAPVTASATNSTLTRRGHDAIATDRWNCYTADVGIGSPATTYTLLLDNGSSNTWIKDYKRTKTSVKQKDESGAVTYSQGYMEGPQYLDSLSLAGVTVTKQSLTRVTSSSGFDDVDGLLAFGPDSLSEGTVTNAGAIPTFVDNLYSQGHIPSKVVGVSFVPVSTVTDSSGDANGVMTLGGVDESQYVGDILWLPITTRSPANSYWGINADAMSYTTPSGSVIPLTSGPTLRSGIVDTGTTLVKIPSDAYNLYVSQIPGAFYNSSNGFLQIPDASLPYMGNFTFTFGGQDFVLTPSAQLFPSQVAAQFFHAGQAPQGSQISVFQDAGSINSGWDFTLGMQFLERYYSAYDSTKKLVGLARTSYTDEQTTPQFDDASVVLIANQPAQLQGSMKARRSGRERRRRRAERERRDLHRRRRAALEDRSRSIFE